MGKDTAEPDDAAVLRKPQANPAPIPNTKDQTSYSNQPGIISWRSQALGGLMAGVGPLESAARTIASFPALAVKVSLPVAIGGLGGAALAEILPGRELALVITAAVLVALVLLLTKLKQAIESASSDEVRYGVREFFLFIGIGGWLGFIVLDGATYLLLALTLAVGLPLVQANAVKNAVAVPVTIIAMLVFAFKGSIDWTLGAVMGAGSIAGGVLGARLAASLQARKWVFWLLVVVISAELVHLTVHYVFKTH